MADFGGGIPGQVASELSVAVKDIANGVVETLTGTTPTAVSAGGQTGGEEKGQVQADPKAVAAKKRLEEVRGELQAYYEQQKKREEQEEQMAEEQKKMEEVQMKESKRKQEERQVLGRLSRQYGGTGEVGKSGY